MILVTGATGNVGSQIVNQLIAAGHKVRVFTREPQKVASWGDRVEVARGDLTRPETFAPAIAGVESIFLMNGALDWTAFNRLLEIAKSQGGPRVVFLSSLFAAEPDLAIGRLHKDKEDALRASGLPFAIVRAGGFMSNAYQWLGSIQTEGVVYNPMGEGKVASTHPADIAAIAAYALTEPELSEAQFDVTGEELLTTAAKVEILSRVLGKPLRVVDVPAAGAVEGLVKNGIPPRVAEALGQSFEAIRQGRAAQVTATVRRVTGRPAQTFAAWAQEHASRFA